MTKQKESVDLSVTFAGLQVGETGPKFAAYQIDTVGRPVGKIGSYDGKVLRIKIGSDVGVVAFGPDVEDYKDLDKEQLVIYRVSQKIKLWEKHGVIFPKNVWDRFHFEIVCVTGTVRKCRPWYWLLMDDIRLRSMFHWTQEARIKPITADLNPHLHFPFSCLPVCDGTVEIFERRCCCQFIIVRELLERLREILDDLPIPIPDPTPGPGPDPGPLSPQLLRAKARTIQKRKMSLNLVAVPPENLYHDYLALRTMSDEVARLYVLDRPYLFPIFCHCTVRKVGQTPIEPGGRFDFCYHRVHHHPHIGYCFTTYAFKIKQLINGVMTVVYDGLAAHQYFGAGAPADIRIFNPRAIVCAESSGDPPPNDGMPFVMLEHVGSSGTYHFNFPAQTGESQFGTLDASDGTYTYKSTPDCPWGGMLGLRLWFSPELESIVGYYRLKVIKIGENGAPNGDPIVLNDSVTWDKLVDIPGGFLIRVPETLGPNPVNGENDLFRVPYWKSPDNRYLSGQFHQMWNTASTLFPDGRYMLVIEVFDTLGQRIKPNGAAGSGTAHNFQFRRWTSAASTDPVPFGDAAHIFYVDNTPVVGDIVDLRQDGDPHTGECQFMTGVATSTFAIGFKAYHIHGVEHAGTGDKNSFMMNYAISWQRGLNGPSGALGAAGGNNSADVGESGNPDVSGSQTFATMLDGHPKCTFSVTLDVYAKHINGSDYIHAYDYHETASFALEINGTGNYRIRRVERAFPQAGDLPDPC